MDVFTFSEKLPDAGNLALYSKGNDTKWNEQGFLPPIQRAALTTVIVVLLQNIGTDAPAKPLNETL